MTALLQLQVEPSENRLEKRVHEMLLAEGVEFVVHPKIRVQMLGKRRRLTPDFFVPSQNLVIEVNGCWVHGCEVCGCNGYGSERKRWHDQVRLEALERAGYTVEVIWEHEIVPNEGNASFATGRARRRRPGGHTTAVLEGRLCTVAASPPS